MLRLLCLAVMEVRASETTFDEHNKKNEAKKVMVRKTVEIRSDDVGGDGGIVVCEESDSTKQRKRAPNVICMRLNRLDGRRSA